MLNQYYTLSKQFNDMVSVYAIDFKWQTRVHFDDWWSQFVDDSLSYDSSIFDHLR